MRIASGILKGRLFDVPSVGVRPTTQRTREAVFSSLVSQIVNARVLDLFAGSGGMGLEALSRGAKEVVSIEKNAKACKAIVKNFCALKNSNLGFFNLVRSDVYSYLKHNNESFDVIFADPPYDEVDLPKLLEAALSTIAKDGVLVFEMRAKGSYSVPECWAVRKEKEYGSTRVVYLELNN